MNLQLNWGEIIRKKIRNKIFVSSIHQVKGLEFSNVFIIGAENFNKTCSFERDCYPKLKEEINLLYVACTRTTSSLTQTFVNKIIRDGTVKGRWIFCAFKVFEKFFKFIDLKTSKSIPLNKLICFKWKDENFPLSSTD